MTFTGETYHGSSREVFEAVHLGGNKQAARRNEHGDYVLPSVQDAYAGWSSCMDHFFANQAAQSAQVPEKQLLGWAIKTTSHQARPSPSGAGDELPPLPISTHCPPYPGSDDAAFTADQMREYARLALSRAKQAAQSSPAVSDENGNLPCPFCGGVCDPNGWYGENTDGTEKHGPECETCGACAETIAQWNTRTLLSQPAEQVPVEAIGRLLEAAMNDAIKNGANSISMPDEYVEIAVWLAAIAPQPNYFSSKNAQGGDK